MRVLANGQGADVLFTLFRLDGITDEEFRRDLGLVPSVRYRSGLQKWTLHRR